MQRAAERFKCCSVVLRSAEACFKSCSGSVQRATGRFKLCSVVLRSAGACFKSCIGSVQRALGRFNTIIPLIFNVFLQQHVGVASLQNAAPGGEETGDKFHHKKTQIKWLKTSYQSPTTRLWPSPKMLRSAGAFLIAAVQRHD